MHMEPIILWKFIQGNNFMLCVYYCCRNCALSVAWAHLKHSEAKIHESLVILSLYGECCSVKSDFRWGKSQMEGLTALFLPVIDKFCLQYNCSHRRFLGAWWNSCKGSSWNISAPTCCSAIYPMAWTPWRHLTAWKLYFLIYLQYFLNQN